ncbi:MAG: protein kinase [Planctomycetaceae bacterium]
MLEASQKAGDFLESPPLGLDFTVAGPAFSEGPGDTIGPYKLREQIGEGGMGLVFVAEQTAPVRRQVALKVCKPGMDTKEVMGRFEAERQALAVMDHPNIAKVFDAGTTDSGRPYFVMELVRGIPITEYCERAKLDTRERLKLFITVCQAVQHAHMKGIIHRDIKPTNVMVTLHDGVPVPKVIDFGVAKALNQRLTEQTVYTQYSQLIGTPLYMSPEQAEFSGLDIDTRTDVYSLGVLLYELLTGTTPFEKQTLAEKGLDEFRRLLREQDPPRPSAKISTLDAAAQSTLALQRGLDPRQLTRSLKGELDWIVMKSLEKDRNRRYESASDFAADVQRYLTDEPVEACPPSAAYRLKKLIHRNWTALATTAIVVTALIIGTAVSVWQSIEATSARRLANERLNNETIALRDAITQGRHAEKQRHLAEANFQKALDAVEQMLTRVADEKLARIPGVESVRKQLLEDAIPFYEQLLEQHSEDPELRFKTAKAWQRIGFIKERIFDDLAGGTAALEKAINIAEAVLRESPNDVRYLEVLAHSCAKLGCLYRDFGPNWPRSEAMLDRGLAACRDLERLLPGNLEHRLIATENQYLLAGIYRWSGREPQAVDLGWEVVQAQRKLLAENPHSARIRGYLMYSLEYQAGMMATRDYEAADRLLAEAESLGEIPRPYDSDEFPRGVLDEPELVLPIVLSRRTLLRFQKKLETLSESEARVSRAITLLEEYRASHPDLVRGCNYWAEAKVNYSRILIAMGRTGEAEHLLRDACRVLLEDYSTALYWPLTGALDVLSSLLNDSGRGDDAELAAIRRKFGVAPDEQPAEDRNSQGIPPPPALPE